MSLGPGVYIVGEPVVVLKLPSAPADLLQTNDTPFVTAVKLKEATLPVHF